RDGQPAQEHRWTSRLCRKLISLRPEDVADDDGDEQSVGVVLVGPPVTRQFHQYRSIGEKNGRNYGKGAPVRPGGRSRDTHKRSLSFILARKGQFPLRKCGRRLLLHPESPIGEKAYLTSMVRDNKIRTRTRQQGEKSNWSLVPDL